jgi:hypothetical protein
MPAEIDIIVSSPDSTEARLIVEAKLVMQDRAAAEAQLKLSMLQLSCPVGLIITPERMWIYSDRYTSSTPGSIQTIGDFAIGHLLRFTPSDRSPREGGRFESAVQHWLENLPQTASPELINDSSLWRALNTYIIPAIETGKVRAAAPRHR